jgi:hypothetical protein
MHGLELGKAGAEPVILCMRVYDTRISGLDDRPKRHAWQPPRALTPTAPRCGSYISACLQDWDAQLRGLTAKAAAYDRQYESALRSLDAIKPGVHSIFQKLGSTDPALTEALAASGVTDSNVMQHLASVEQRVNEIMQVCAGCMKTRRLAFSRRVCEAVTTSSH